MPQIQLLTHGSIAAEIELPQDSKTIDAFLRKHTRLLRLNEPQVLDNWLGLVRLVASGSIAEACIVEILGDCVFDSDTKLPALVQWLDILTSCGLNLGATKVLERILLLAAMS